MSDSPPSPQPLQTHESDVVSEVPPSLNQGSPNQPGPPPKAHPETAPPNPDPEYNSPDEDDDDEEEGEEIEEETPAIPSSGMPLHIHPPITDPHVSAPDVALTSPNSRRGGGKWKKGKGKGKNKGKSNAKKQQAIQEKLQSLMKNLNPIPFIPTKIPDFAKHEKLLRKLGLWDFVHIDFDRTIRVDLIAQLVANYTAKSRASYVNGFRVMVNRADLARAFKLPFKKEKGNVGGGVEVDLDWEALSEDSIGFFVEFFSDWVLVHEDMWLMPNEVMDWLKLIKEGHPEKVDWAGVLWFMVEKELKQGGQLRDCYYASHLQHLIKFQREEVFLTEEPSADEVQLDIEAKEEKEEVNEESVKVVDAIDSPREKDPVIEGPSTKLTLGQDGENEEGTKDVEMMDAEKCEDSDKEEGGEEQGQWLLDGKNDLGEHFMQPCRAENAEEFGGYEDRKDEEEEMDGEEDAEEDEEEAGNSFHFPNDDSLDGDGFTGNFLQTMGANQMAFSSQDQLRNPSSLDVRADMQQIASAPSFFNSAGKRVIEHDNHISHHSVDDSNKRLRINDPWDNKPVDFGMCMEQIQQVAVRARMLYEEKEQSLAQSNVNQQILLNEMQKRDTVIEHLHKARLEETQKKDQEIYRLERELMLMGSVLDGYRKALKEVKKAFADYRERAQLPEEPTYKDTGLGGLMLTAPELEKLRKKQEEEYKMNCLILEQKMREAEEDFAGQFHGYVDKINLFDERLTRLESDGKELIELYVKRKNAQSEENVAEVAEPQPVPEPEEKGPDVAETLPITEPKEKSPGAAEPLPIPPTDEKVPEAAEPLPVPPTDEKVPEVAETVPVPPTDEKVPEVAETVPVPPADEKVPEVATVSPTDEKVPEVAETVPVPPTDDKVPEVAETVPVPPTDDKVPEVAETLQNE